jgi:taurine dioxygenase
MKVHERPEIFAIPAGRALGAEIRGIDLSVDLDEATVAEIRNLLLQHLVLVFRDQNITPEQQTVFARRFGPLQRHDYVPGLAQHPEVIEIRKEPHHVQNFGGIWHSDNSYLRNPPLGSILYALEIPDEGGDTLWANQYLAYEDLPPKLKRQIEPLFAVHSPNTAFGTMPRINAGPITGPSRESTCEAVHPLIRTHPETGRKALFHSGACTICLKNWTIEDSKPMLDHLMSHATRNEITFRHRWRRHDVVFWDNRCTMHIAMNDYSGKLRVVHRVSIEGTVPH